MFRAQLVGGSKRELHNAGVVAAVLAEPARVGELFECVLDRDEYVRMRAADALEKLCRTNRAILEPFTERVLEEMAVSDQPSVQWHVAQILGQLPLDAPRRRRAVTLVREYLDTSNDWIVLSHAMDTLARFAEHDPRLRRAIDPKLARLADDPRKAVAKRATRIRQRLGLPVTPPPSTTVATHRWRTVLAVDPVPLLGGCGHPAIEAFARRDLLDDTSVDVSALWELPGARRVLERQQRDGRWRYRNPKPEIRSVDDYDQLETYRQLSVLVHRFGFDRRHPAVEAARRFLAAFQTAEGDYRGIYGRQYTPNYSAAITEVLIHAGYGRDPGVEATMRWLLSIRQDDGGWAIPLRTRGERLEVMRTRTSPIEPDRTRPSSHLVTGVVLRAFAAHPRHRQSAAAGDAGRWLANRLFRRDHYPDHAAPSYWTVFSYPFWWTDLLSALDVFTTLGWNASDPAVAPAVAWFVDHQDPSGVWYPGRNRPKGPDSDHWVALAACRALRRASAMT